MNKTTLGISFTCILLLVGCAAPTTRQVGLDPELVRLEEQKQLQLAIKQDREFDERLQRLSWPILKSAAPLCEGNTVPKLGFQYANIHAYAKEYQSAARAVLGLDDRVKVIGVAPGGPADLAGIQVGDVFVKVNGQEVPVGKKAFDKYAKLASKAVELGPTVTFNIDRNGEILTLVAELQEVCRFPAIFSSSDEVNAYADGDAIYITRGMMRFADDDQELSLVIAHELAHNSQEHIKSKMKNYWLGAIFDIAAAAYGANTQGAFGNMAAQAYSQEFEAEADYVGLYAMAHADLEVQGAADFWREMGIQHPGSITKSYASSHPSTAERFVALENAAKEIQMKIEVGFPLLPEMKD